MSTPATGADGDNPAAAIDVPLLAGYRYVVQCDRPRRARLASRTCTAPRRPRTVCRLSSASMPNSRMDWPWISMVSPSMTVAWPSRFAAWAWHAQTRARARDDGPAGHAANVAVAGAKQSPAGHVGRRGFGSGCRPCVVGATGRGPAIAPTAVTRGLFRSGVH
jgi:hypothetical protein